MGTYPLTSLLRLRRSDEQRAEHALAQASAARARAEEESAGLSDRVRRARAALDAQRAGGSAAGPLDRAPPRPLRAADLVAAEMFRARLDDDLAASSAARAAYDRDVTRPARAAEDAARTRWLTARARREAVEKTIARREAVQRRAPERRLDAEADDLAAARAISHPPLRSPPSPR